MENEQRPGNKIDVCRLSQISAVHVYCNFTDHTNYVLYITETIENVLTVTDGGVALELHRNLPKKTIFRDFSAFCRFSIK